MSELILDGFENYVVETTPTPTAFFVFCSVYVGISFCIIAPLLTCCSRRYTRTRQEESQNAFPLDGNEGLAAPEQEMVTIQNGNVSSLQYVHNDLANGDDRPKRNGGIEAVVEATPITATLPQTNGSAHIRSDPQLTTTSNFPLNFRRASLGRRASMGQASATHSAATTSRLRESSVMQRRDSNPTTPTAGAGGRKRPTRAWEPASMRWKHRRPIGRIEARERSVRSERQSQIISEDESVAASWNSRPGGRTPSHNRGMSDVAGNILERESIEGEAEFYRQRYLQRASRSRRRGSATASDISILPALSPDALAPGDAADAHDPGTANCLEDYEEETTELVWPFNKIYSFMGVILDLAEPDFETRRILTLAIPSTISAVSEPLFRLVLVAIISHFIDTDSMVAFVLVILFVRITMEELSAAVTDTESTLVQNALAEGGDAGFFEVGQQVQLAVIMQVLIGVPVLLAWAYVMDDVVLWLVDSSRVASIASDYTQVIVIDYIVQATCGAFMLVFLLSGNEQFDSNVDLSATLLTLLAIALIVGSQESPTLVSIGWVQVAIGVAKTFVKVAYVVLKGWAQPYKRGLLGKLSLRVSQSPFLDNRVRFSCH
jgi:hypothetical protein